MLEIEAQVRTGHGVLRRFQVVATQRSGTKGHWPLKGTGAQLEVANPDLHPANSQKSGSTRLRSDREGRRPKGGHSGTK